MGIIRTPNECLYVDTVGDLAAYGRPDSVQTWRIQGCSVAGSISAKFADGSIGSIVVQHLAQAMAQLRREGWPEPTEWFRPLPAVAALLYDIQEPQKPEQQAGNTADIIGKYISVRKPRNAVKAPEPTVHSPVRRSRIRPAS